MSKMVDQCLTGIDSNTSTPKTNEGNNGFICGVIEGFYGRPWTADQRKDLFVK